MNVLIVDDEKEVSDLLTLYLEGKTCTPFAALLWQKLFLP